MQLVVPKPGQYDLENMAEKYFRDIQLRRGAPHTGLIAAESAALLSSKTFFACSSSPLRLNLYWNVAPGRESLAKRLPVQWCAPQSPYRIPTDVVRHSSSIRAIVVSM